MRRVLVTGAAGFVGRTLTEMLATQGAEVVALDARAPAPAPVGVDVRTDDVCDASAVEHACRDVDVVFHLAALLPQARAPRREMHRVNVEGTRAVADAARHAGVRRLVYLSSSEVYGLPAVVPCPEEAPLRPLGEYGRNKVQAERLLATLAGIEVVVLRPVTVVGPGMREPMIESLLRTAHRRLPLPLPGGGRRRLQFLAAADAVHACLLAATVASAAGTTCNLGHQPALSMRELADRLRAELDLPARPVPVPEALAKPLVLAAARLPFVPLEPDHAPAAFVDYVLDTSRARHILGWEAATDPVNAIANYARSLEVTWR